MYDYKPFEQKTKTSGGQELFKKILIGQQAQNFVLCEYMNDKGVDVAVYVFREKKN